MPRAKQLTVQLANKPGTLSHVAQILGRAKVNMRALAVFEGRAKIIADDPAKGRDALQQEGLYASIEDCLAVDMADQPGSLGEICGKLSAAGVNIDYSCRVGTCGTCRTRLVSQRGYGSRGRFGSRRQRAGMDSHLPGQANRQYRGGGLTR